MKSTGLFLLVLFPVLVVLFGCRPREQGPTEEEIAAMVAEDRRLAKEARLREREQNRQRIMEELRLQDLEKQKVRKAQREAEKAAGREEEVSPIEWEEIERKMVARLGAIGTKWDVLWTRSGTMYKDVVVRDAYATGLSLFHEGGKVEIGYEELPNTLQAKFLFDADEAKNPLPKITSAQMNAIRERLSRERRNSAQKRSSSAAFPKQPGKHDDREAMGLTGERSSTLMAQRRRLANRLNAEVHKLTKMQDAGMSDGHAVVQKQKQLIANAERALKKAEAAVMAERRRRIGG